MFKTLNLLSGAEENTTLTSVCGDDFIWFSFNVIVILQNATNQDK